VTPDSPFPSRLARELNASYARFYSKVNPGRERDVAKARANDQATFGRLLDALPSGSPVLDVGCGQGLLLSWLRGKPNLVLAGVDSSAGQLAAARPALGGVEIHEGDGLRFLRDNPERFAAILCFDVLEHLIGDDPMLDWVLAAHGALRPGGIFLCRVPNGANLTGSYERYIDLTHRRAFTSKSLLQLLELGFESSEILDVRSGHVAGRVRLALEYALHRAMFRLCSHHLERFFTRDLYGLGRRPAADPAP
jgi:SAM-dependent methyltransferase